MRHFFAIISLLLVGMACALQADGTDICFQGDVNATIDFGFDSVKYDGGGMEKIITHFAMLYNRTGKAVLLEDCGNGNPARAAAVGYAAS